MGTFFRVTRVSVRCSRRCCFCQHDPGHPKAKKRQRHQKLHRSSDSTARTRCDITDMTTTMMTVVTGTEFGDKLEKNTSVGWRLGGRGRGGGGGGGTDGRLFECCHYVNASPGCPCTLTPVSESRRPSGKSVFVAAEGVWEQDPSQGSEG